MNTIEVARVLDMSPDDVAVLARKGTIRGRKVGRQWRFQRSDVSFLK
ncbi:helix-turn-helix domain-containing protein [Thermodesulfobacteriota bacterium]